MPNYNLYTELALDKDMPPAEIGQLLDSRINTLLGQGYQQNSPEVDQLATARAILSDPVKRDTYEAALAGPDGVVDVRWLHGLADSAPSVPSGSSSHPAPASPSSPTFPESLFSRNPVSGASGQESFPTSSASSSFSEVSSDSASSSASAASPYGASSAGAADASQSYGATPFSQPAQGSSSSTDFSSRFAAGSYGGASGPQPAAAPVSQTKQFGSAEISVEGRSRSQSKVYLACLAVIALGMLYPLVILFTAGEDDVDAVYSILKALLFTVAHAVAWLAVAEAIWSARRILAPSGAAGSQARPVAGAPAQFGTTTAAGE